MFPDAFAPLPKLVFRESPNGPADYHQLARLKRLHSTSQKPHDPLLVLYVHPQ
jgi:hypothetical protein